MLQAWSFTIVIHDARYFTLNFSEKNLASLPGQVKEHDQCMAVWYARPPVLFHTPRHFCSDMNCFIPKLRDINEWDTISNVKIVGSALWTPLHEGTTTDPRGGSSCPLDFPVYWEVDRECFLWALCGNDIVFCTNFEAQLNAHFPCSGTVTPIRDATGSDDADRGKSYDARRVLGRCCRTRTWVRWRIALHRPARPLAEAARRSSVLFPAVSACPPQIPYSSNLNVNNQARCIGYNRTSESE